MYGWSFIFLILAVIAAIFGYPKPSTTFNYIAKLLFYVFLFVFMAFVIAGFFSSIPPQPTTGLPLV